jgi:hypothetical protein
MIVIATGNRHAEREISGLVLVLGRNYVWGLNIATQEM